MSSKKPKPEPTPEGAAAEEVERASMAEALEHYNEYVTAQAATIWQYDEIPVTGLNLEDRLFVRSYIIDRNPIAAMRRLGHQHEDDKKLKARAKRYLEKAAVAEAIEWLGKRLMEKLDITAEKVQRQMAAVAFFDPREVMEFDKFGVRIVNSRFWTAEQAAAISSIKMGQYGLEMKLYDRLKASEMLAKQIGLQPDESDAAQQARMAADEAMERIASTFTRLLPGGNHVTEERLAKRSNSEKKTH